MARGRYAALQQEMQDAQEPIEPASAYAHAAAYLSDTLDWLNLWQDNTHDHSLDDEFVAEQDQISPHL